MITNVRRPDGRTMPTTCASSVRSLRRGVAAGSVTVDRRRQTAGRPRPASGAEAGRVRLLRVGPALTHVDEFSDRLRLFLPTRATRLQRRSPRTDERAHRLGIRRRAGGEATGSRPSDRSSPMCTNHLCMRRSRTRTRAITGRAISPQVNDTLGPALQDDDAGSIPDTGSTRHELDNNGMRAGYGHRLVARRQIRDVCGLVRRRVRGRGVDRRGHSTPRRRARRCGPARSDRSSLVGRGSAA